MVKTDILVVGSGCAALYFALQIPEDRRVLLITKADFESSDSFLAQGGICMLRDEEDYQSYFDDTMKAGHEENDKGSVDIMIRSSQDVIRDLIACGVSFARTEDGALAFTREGAHSNKRILFHEDITGKEITSHLLEQAKKRPNITMMKYTAMLDILTSDQKDSHWSEHEAASWQAANQNEIQVGRNNWKDRPLVAGHRVCRGAVIRDRDGRTDTVLADYTVFATGGIGGLFRHSTNFRQLTGDAVAIALKHGIETEHVNYIQVHPTTFYSE
ncbi:MAG: FAD-binding protein, partial [Eubacterium sp.]|nr:FAD-binding protein [Eubacterium sp.]